MCQEPGCRVMMERWTHCMQHSLRLCKEISSNCGVDSLWRLYQAIKCPEQLQCKKFLVSHCVSAANLNIAPAGALAIGIGSGCLSTLGYVSSQPYLEKKIGLRDTCGVINLHAGPGIMGGLAAGEGGKKQQKRPNFNLHMSSTFPVHSP